MQVYLQAKIIQVEIYNIAAKIFFGQEILKRKIHLDTEITK